MLALARTLCGYELRSTSHKPTHHTTFSRSGKTCGFLLPGMMHIRAVRRDPRFGPVVLVLAPTRELAMQVRVCRVPRMLTLCTSNHCHIAQACLQDVEHCQRCGVSGLPLCHRPCTLPLASHHLPLVPPPNHYPACRSKRRPTSLGTSAASATPAFTAVPPKAHSWASCAAAWRL